MKTMMRNLGVGSIGGGHQDIGPAQFNFLFTLIGKEKFMTPLEYIERPLLDEVEIFVLCHCTKETLCQ